MSTWPNASSALVLRSTTVDLYAASPSTTMALAPSASASSLTWLASSAFDLVLITTFAPRAANSSTIALPRLRPEPVTSRVFPAIPNSSVMVRCASFLGMSGYSYWSLTDAGGRASRAGRCRIAGRDGEMARDQVPLPAAGRRLEHRGLRGAPGLRPRAPGADPASGRRVDRRR